MKNFRLPDLGEGLPDAEIREWYVQVGDEIQEDQPMVAMETAKALVDVPAPFSGKVEKLYGAVGDTINVGDPLIGFEGEGEEEVVAQDAGTVVGAIEVSDTVIQESATGVQASASSDARARATPKVRSLARRLGVDLSQIHTNNPRITEQDVRAAAGKPAASNTAAVPEGYTQLSAVRRAMILSMNQSHADVVPVTLCDDADISAWKGKQDTTLRIIRALQAACEASPMLNCHFNGASMSYQLNENINIGIAVDTEHGLYVPVLKNVNQRDDASLREDINRFKEQALTKSIPQDDLKGATIILSNFGSIAGRYANPIILPPMVAIVGVGKSRETVVAVEGEVQIHKIMPLSVTTDHRAITGGEAARFLSALMNALAQAEK